MTDNEIILQWLDSISWQGTPPDVDWEDYEDVDLDDEGIGEAERTYRLDLSREPNRYEQKVDCAHLTNQLDTLERQTKQRLVELLTESKSAMLIFVERNWDTIGKALQDLRLKGMNDIQETIGEFLRQAYQIGWDSVGREVQYVQFARGNWGHGGRPGKVGGSVSRGVSIAGGAGQLVEVEGDVGYHHTSAESAQQIQAEGFQYSRNSMYGQGVYLTDQKGGYAAYGDSVISVRLSSHKQIKIADDTDSAKVYRELIGSDQFSTSNFAQKMTDAGIGSAKIGVDKESYLVIFDKALIQDIRIEKKFSFVEMDSMFTPKEALAYLKQKKFWVSGLLKDSVTKEIKAIILNAIKSGELPRETQQKIADVFEPYIGNENVLRDQKQLEPYRIETILRTNATDALNHGRLVRARQLPPELLSGMQYSAIIDARTTEICRHLDGKVFRSDDPMLDSLTPPNHHNCRSVLVPVTIAEKVSEEEYANAETIGKARDLMDPSFGGSVSKSFENKGWSSQPRVPSGSPTGGEWTDSGGSGVGGAAPVESQILSREVETPPKGIKKMTLAPIGTEDQEIIRANKKAIDEALSVVPESAVRGLNALYVTGGGEWIGSAMFMWSPPKSGKPKYVHDEITLMGGWQKKSHEDKVSSLVHEVGHRMQLNTHKEVFKQFDHQGLGRYFSELIDPQFQKNYKAKHKSGEAFAESFARFVLKGSQSTELNDFWSKVDLK